jgi:hypothetical protein
LKILGDLLDDFCNFFSMEMIVAHFREKKYKKLEKRHQITGETENSGL